MNLGYPFNEIFDSRESAEAAFELLEFTLRHLNVTEDDPRLAVTLPVNKQLIRLNFGNWAVMELNDKHLALALPLGSAPVTSNVSSWGAFANQDDSETPIAVQQYPLGEANEVKEELMAQYEVALKQIAQRFSGWSRSQYHRHHRVEIAEAALNPELRNDLLKNGVVLARKMDAFLETAAEFDRDVISAEIATAEQQRAEVLQRFPLEAWPDLPLERYALGQEDSHDTYCYWLEFGTSQMGSIGGGSASKHIIYKHKNKPGWYFSAEYSDVSQAWVAVRSAFVEMFALAQAGKWEKIIELDAISGGRVLRTKSLHVYFPDQILPITSSEHLKHLLTKLGAYRHEMRYWDPILLNRELLRVLRSSPELDAWTTNELEKILYSWSDPKESGRVVKISPGEGAKYWEDCLQNGYICVGWDEAGELTAYDNYGEFYEQFGLIAEESFEYDKSTTTKKAKELWTLRELEPGDIVVAAQGMSEVHGIGQVVEPGYEWLGTRSEAKHVVHVQWDTQYARRMTLPKAWKFVTIANVSSDLYRKIISTQQETGAPLQDKVNPETPLVKPPGLYTRLADALERKRQIILYGPPGTGKTFHARGFAVWWLLKQQNDLRRHAVIGDPAALKQMESELTTGQVKRRTWWMVANPNEWGWEELFRDGVIDYRRGRIQRNYPLVQPGDLVIGYQSTPDKRIVALARVARGLHNVNGEPRILLKPERIVQNGLTYEELLADPLLAKSEPLRNRCQGTLFALTEEETDVILARLAERDPSLQTYGAAASEVSPLTWVTFHPSYSYEDFVEGFRPVESADSGLVLKMEDGLFKRICREAQIHPDKRYLIVIDEINRANLAKVFGELITLLEKDKRGLTITLPQSKESFSVPENVFLLGTMNTADRSIKLMDTALRRRFAFIELMPDVAPLAGATVNGLALDDFLLALNRRVARHEGREKQLGHALLMDDGEAIADSAEFARRFRQEILPLLQEYCYDNYEDLADYIGTQLVDADARQLNADVLDSDDDLIATLAALTASENATD